MTAIIIAMLSPALWAAGNHIDKYLVDRRMQNAGVGAALVFSSLVGVPMALIFWLLRPHVTAIHPLNAAILTFNGVLYIFSLLPYLLALQRDDASVVVPLFQLTVVFSYGLGLVFLGEQLTPAQAGGSLFIIAGSLVLTLHWRAGMRLKHDVLLLMLAAAFLNALNWFLFKYAALSEDFFVSNFWEYAGFSIAALGLLLVARCRNEFFQVLATNSRRVIGLASLNEMLALGAKLATNIASLFLPLAVISSIHSMQSFFVLIFGLVLLSVTPHHYKQDNIHARAILQRMAAIVMIVAGAVALSLL
jgi:drug/metabolite transporter (DMT)-like permease